MRPLGKAASDDDRPLIERVRKGDQDAVRALYERYFDRIYNYVYARLGRAEDAEDLALDTMTRSLTRLDLFQDQGVAFSSWIYRIAHNATIDHYRRHGKVVLVSLEHAPALESADPSELAVEQLSNADLHTAIRELTDEQQQVLILRFFQDLTAAQVASIMGKSVGAVQALQHRALGSLELAAVEQSNSARVRVHPIRRLVLATLAAVVLLVAGAVAASADSLPDSVFYPLKGVLENTRGALTFGASDQLAYRLDLARTRLTEAQAMFARHRVDLADRALNALNDQLNDAALVIQAEKQSDPAVGAAMENRLRQAIATHDAQLPGHNLVFLVASILVVAAVAVVVIRGAPGTVGAAALGAVAGGASSNLIDRVRLGSVIDFIEVHLWPTDFNLADAAIRLGVLVFVLTLLFGRSRRSRRNAASRPAG